MSERDVDAVVERCLRAYLDASQDKPISEKKWQVMQSDMSDPGGSWSGALLLEDVTRVSAVLSAIRPGDHLPNGLVAAPADKLTAARKDAE